MKKFLFLSAIVGGLALVGMPETVQAGHDRYDDGCYSSGYYGGHYRARYYRPRYYSYRSYRPSFGYYRPGFSFSIGGRYPSYGYRGYYGRGHRHHYRHHHGHH